MFYGLYSAIFRNHREDIEFLEKLSIAIEVDIVIRLLVELWRNITTCQYEVFTVNYTFFLALMDLIAALPLPYYYMALRAEDDQTIDDIRFIPLFSLLKIFHVFRMTKILGFVQMPNYSKIRFFQCSFQCSLIVSLAFIAVKLQNDMNVKGHIQFFVSILRYVIQYLLIVHVSSCIIFWVGKKVSHFLIILHYQC